MPFRADCLPQLTEALGRRLPKPVLDQFREHWRGVPADAHEFPCPFCFAAGRDGALVEQTEIGGIAALRCTLCAEQILVRVGI
jgi:hypothetical protein